MPPKTRPAISLFRRQSNRELCTRLIAAQFYLAPRFFVIRPRVSKASFLRRGQIEFHRRGEIRKRRTRPSEDRRLNSGCGGAARKHLLDFNLFVTSIDDRRSDTIAIFKFDIEVICRKYRVYRRYQFLTSCCAVTSETRHEDS